MHKYHIIWYYLDISWYIQLVYLHVDVEENHINYHVSFQDLFNTQKILYKYVLWIWFSIENNQVIYLKLHNLSEAYVYLVCIW